MLRKGENIDIKIPMYKDVKTEINKVLENEKYPGHIHLDSFNFGMGNCGLQATFGNENLDDARWLYDQFNVLSPIMLAFSAASPVIKGK